MAAPQLRLDVSLNLTGFRSEIQKLTNIAQSEFAPKINVKFNRQTLDTELNNLQAAIKRRTYRIEIGGNIDSLPDKIKALKEQLSSLESFKIDLGIGAVKSLSKKDASKINSELRAQVLGEQKKIYVPVSIKPSVVKKDVLDFKNAVQSKLSGITVKVKADLEAASISGGAKSRADINADVRRKLQEISEIGAQRMAGGGGGVTEAARRAQLKRSLETGGFDIGGLKDIGKQLGISNAGRYKNANSLINKIVADASIEMVKKYLDPQAVMRNSDRSGLSKVLDTFARGVFNMLGIDPASIRAQQQASRQKAFTPAGLLPEYTSRGAREEIMRRLGGADGGRDGKLALNNEAMGQRIGAILQEYFKVAEVQVRESFNPRELKQSLNVFSYIVQSLQDAETRTKQARVDESVDSLMNTISQSLKIAEATVRIRLAQVRELPQRPSQGMLPGTRIAGLLSPESAGRYRGGGAVETREELFARREREARMRSALRGLSVSSERGLELPGTTFMGDDFTRGGGRDRVTGSGQPPQRGDAIMRHPGGPQLGPASRLPSDYFEKGGTTDKYREGLRLAAAATDSFRAGQIPFLSGLKNIAGEFGEATKQVLLYGTAYKGLAFITSLPGQILNAAKSQQQFNNGLQTATQSTGTFAKELLYVDNVQRAFGLNLQTTRTGFTRLFASMAPTGFDSGSIEKLFTGISAATASLQLTPDKAERVIYAFGQMASKGQIMSEELKGQLGDVLPGALSLFADAAGMSVKQFSEAMERGEFVGSRFREVFAKVSDELMDRFGTGAQAAARSLQGLINVVGGDFQRTLESFAPLANAAAESILKPLGGAFRQLSVAARLATGEKGRMGGQITQQEKLVQDLGAEASLGGPDADKAKEQYEGAKQALEALKIQLENFNELAKDPAVIRQAENIKAFTDEIGKAASFVQNFVSSVGNVLSPVLTFLGTNLTSAIGTVISLTLAFQGARLGLLAFVGVMTVIKGAVAAVGLLSLVQQVGSFSAALAVNGTLGKTVATMFTALGVSAKFVGGQIVFASGATMSFGLAAKALLATTGLGLLILVIGSVGAAFAAMGEDAKRAAEDAKQAAKDMAEAARTGNVPQVEAGIRQAQADVPLIKEAQSIVKRGQLGVAFETLDRGTLTEEDQAILSAAGLSLPDGVVYKKDLLKQLNDLLAVRNSVLSKGNAQLALAEKQRKRTGEGIPSLGLKSTEPPEKDDAAEQRGKTLLNVIEQREEAIADARKQREESIASIRKNAAEEFMRMEQSLADRRLNIEREIIAVKQKSADTLKDIQRQIRIARGEDSDIVGDEQKVADIYRKERDANLEITQRIADEEKEQARNIAAFQKKVANDIQSANEAHTKRMGEIQRSYAKQVAKIIEDGTSKAAKRMAYAGELAAKYIERASLLQARASVVIPDGSSLPTIPRPVASGSELVYPNLTPDEVPDQFKRIDRRVIELERNLRSSRQTPDIGEQLAGMLSAEGGFDVSKVATDFGTIAAASILRGVLDVSRVPDASRSAQIAQAHNVNVGDQAGYYQPQSQQTSPAGAPYGATLGTPEAARTTESRERLQSTVQDTEAVLRAKNLELLYAQITQDSAKASAEMTKQIDLIKEQAALIRNGINSELAAEFIQLEANYNKEVDRIKARKLAVAIEELLIKEAEKLRDTLKVQTKERILQSKILAGEQTIEKLKEEIKLLLIINNEERKLAELREQYGDAKAQEVFDLTKIKENIEATRALVDGFVSGIASDYKGFLKAVISGEDAVDALKQFQEGLKDRVLTIFLDFAMAPVEKFMKEAMEGLFLPKIKKEAGEPPKETTKDPVEATNSNTNATNTNTTEIKNLTAAIQGMGAETNATPSVQGPTAGNAFYDGSALPSVASGFDAASVFGGGGNLTGGIFDTIAQQMGGAMESFDSFSSHMGNFVSDSVASADAVGSWGDSFNTQLSDSLTKVTDTSDEQGFNFQESLGKAVGAIGIAAGSIMGIAAGISQIKEGGTANVLGGIGSILTSIGGGMMGFMGMFGANGGVAGGGWKPFPVTAFANGGMVNGPTLGLVGEGKYNEAIVPLPDGRSIPVQMTGAGSGSLRDAMGQAPGQSSAPILNMSFESTNINGVEYVSRDQLEQAMAQTRRQASRDGAQRGMTMTLDKLQQSPSTRSRIGMR
jgi:tape measure domain-containing protein